MSTYVFPDWLIPDSFGMQPAGNVKVNQSPMNRATQTVENPGDLWVIRAEFPPVQRAQFRKAQAFFAKFRGGYAHRLRIWNLDLPAPAGTMRGSPTCAGASEGANQVVITASSGSTLIEGDMIGITLSTGLVKLCQVTGVSGTGTMTVDITPPLPRSVNAGAAVVWNKPTVDCVITQHPFLKVVTGGVGDEFELEAVEVPV